MMAKIVVRIGHINFEINESNYVVMLYDVMKNYTLKTEEKN